MNALTHGLTARMDFVVEMVNAKWQQRRVCKFETELFDREMDDQKERLDEKYESYTEIFEQTYAFQRLANSVYLQTLNRTASRLELTYYSALNNLLRLRQVRESSNKKNEKRTESQDRTPTTDHQPPATTNHRPPTTRNQRPISYTPSQRPTSFRYMRRWK